MKKIHSLNQVPSLVKEVKAQGKKIVLVGGVFDLLHYGHIRFLEAAKNQGDILVVALEPDSKVRKTKGDGRPIHSEIIRADVLAALSTVDIVVLLPEFTTDEEYETMVKTLSPDIVAITANDPYKEQKQHHAQKVGAKLISVTAKIPTPSTTQLLKLLAVE